ncbi:MAG: ABC transporter permease subunit [Clostridiales bacterium]|nr:ABC transporter permease subunit [Clostridiales bacterium]
MGRIAAIARAVVTDAIRRRIMWVVALFALVLAAAIPMLPSYGQGIEGAVYREIALALVYVAMIVVALALAANRIPSEIERRTAYIVLVRQVRRWEYVVASWLGIVATLAAAAIIFGLIVFVTGWLVYAEPMWFLWQGVLAIWMEAAIVAAFCVAVSAVSTPVIVAVSALAFLFVTHVRTGLLGGPANPLWNFYPSLDTFNIIAPVAHGSGVSAAYLGAMAFTFAAWVAVLLVAGCVGFSRRDV